MATQRRTRRITTPASPSSPSLPSRRGHHHGFSSQAAARIISPPPQFCAQLSAQPVGRHCRSVSDPGAPTSALVGATELSTARQTWNRRVAMMLPSTPPATHSGSTHGSSEVLHGKRMSMTKLPQLTDCLSFLLPQAPSYAGRRQSHPPTHAHYGSAQHSGAMPTTPRLDAPPTDIAPGVRCAPSTCAEQTHDELSTPLPSPLTSGNR